MRPYLVVYGRRLTGNHDRAEDLAQDTMLRGIQKLDMFVEGTNLKSWLGKMMTNLHIDYVRARKNQPHADIEELSEESLVEEPNQDKSSLVRDIEKVLARLPAFHGKCFRLHAEGYTHSEIAHMLQVRVSIVRQRVHEAVLAVQHELGKGSFSPKPAYHRPQGYFSQRMAIRERKESLGKLVLVKVSGQFRLMRVAAEKVAA
jgi:RNA polymerase sigma-70 factor (ECF subfamily)